MDYSETKEKYESILCVEVLCEMINGTITSTIKELTEQVFFESKSI